MGRRRARLLLRRGQAGTAQADMASGHAYGQPTDPSSRPGALPAETGRRPTRRYRSAAPADLATGPARGGEAARRPCTEAPADAYQRRRYPGALAGTREG